MDFFSYHNYVTSDYSTDHENEVDAILGNCTLYSANCSRILLDEFNLGHNAENDRIKNQTSRWDEYGTYIASIYSAVINKIPSNITFVPYQWTDRYKYSNTASFSEYPHLWYMVSEPDLSNEITPLYNTTKSFATYHRTGSTVYTSSSDNSDVKVVSSKYGNSYYVTIINTDSEQVNVTLNLTNYPYSTIKDMEIGTTYSVNSEVELGLMDGYDILYLGYDADGPVITIDSPSGTYFTSTVDFNVSLDEEGSWCGYSLNGAENVTMTKQGIVTDFKKEVTGLTHLTHTVVFYCNDTFNNFNSTSTSFVVNLDGPGGYSGTSHDIWIPCYKVINGECIYEAIYDEAFCPSGYFSNSYLCAQSLIVEEPKSIIEKASDWINNLFDDIFKRDTPEDEINTVDLEDYNVGIKDKDKVNVGLLIIIGVGLFAVVWVLRSEKIIRV